MNQNKSTFYFDQLSNQTRAAWFFFHPLLEINMADTMFVLSIVSIPQPTKNVCVF